VLKNSGVRPREIVAAELHFRAAKRGSVELTAQVVAVGRKFRVELARKEPDGPFNDTFGGEWLPSLLPPFLYFARLSEAHHGPNRTRGAFTTTRHLIRWLDETGRLSNEERDWLVEALAEHG
jgi:hypothetical protein